MPDMADGLARGYATAATDQGHMDMVASHSTAGRVDRTRPLCPYPPAAHYNGSGSTDDAASFSCAPNTLPADPEARLWLRRLQEGDAR